MLEEITWLNEALRMAEQMHEMLIPRLFAMALCMLRQTEPKKIHNNLLVIQ